MSIKCSHPVTRRTRSKSARSHEGTPVITVIAAAVAPQQKSSPRRRIWALVGFALGGMFGMFWAFGADYVARARRDQEELYRELVSNARQALRSILPRRR